jgi:transposase-like protein
MPEKYTKQQMQNGLDLIASGLSCRKAAQEVGVPSGTLYDHLFFTLFPQ